MSTNEMPEILPTTQPANAPANAPANETFMSPIEREIEQSTAAVLADNQYIEKIFKTQRLKRQELKNLSQQMRSQIISFNNILKKRKETIKDLQKGILKNNEKLYNREKLSKEELEEYKNKYTTEKFYSFYTPKNEDYNDDKYVKVVKEVMSTQYDSSKNDDLNEKLKYINETLLLRKKQINELLKIDKAFDKQIMIKKTQIKDQRSQYFYILNNRNEEIKELRITSSNKMHEILKLPLSEEEEKELYFGRLIGQEMLEKEIEESKYKELRLDSEKYPPKRHMKKNN
jgi:hypothetical protein